MVRRKQLLALLVACVVLAALSVIVILANRPTATNTPTPSVTAEVWGDCARAWMWSNDDLTVCFDVDDFGLSDPWRAHLIVGTPTVEGEGACTGGDIHVGIPYCSVTVGTPGLDRDDTIRVTMILYDANNRPSPSRSMDIGPSP